MSSFDYTAPSVIQTRQYEAAEFVKVQVVLASFPSSPLNFTWPCVPSNEITLAMIKTAVKQRHNGAAADIKLFRDKAMLQELGFGDSDDATLKELGFIGITGGQESNLPSVQVFYGFSPANPSSESIDSSILLA